MRGGRSLLFDMSSDGETHNSKMEAFLRNWRQTAFNAGQFQTAIFVGDKLLALTSRYSLDKVHLDAH